MCLKLVQSVGPLMKTATAILGSSGHKHTMFAPVIQYYYHSWCHSLSYYLVRNKNLLTYILTTYYQCCGSGSVLDSYSGASWIRIRFRNTDPSGSIHANTVQDKMEAKDVRFKILIINSETQLIFVTVPMCLQFKKYTCFKENYFFLKLF